MFPHASDLCIVLPSQVDPSWGINYTAYTDGLAADVFVRDGFTGQPYVSQVWPGPTLMPDWFHPNTEGYWTDSIRTFWQQVRSQGAPSWLMTKELVDAKLLCLSTFKYQVVLIVLTIPNTL